MSGSVLELTIHLLYYLCTTQRFFPNLVYGGKGRSFENREHYATPGQKFILPVYSEPVD
jgi:hypothetical protein